MKEGDRIPEFTAIDQNGRTFTAQDLIGRRTILYFYPKDNTPGCTAEACNLRDNINGLSAAGYQVIGVSRDSDASHRKFIEKYELPFTLLSDKSTEMLQAFGAWGEKKMCGKVSIGTLRKTFIINEEGIIERIIGKVDTKDSLIFSVIRARFLCPACASILLSFFASFFFITFLIIHKYSLYCKNIIIT